MTWRVGRRGHDVERPSEKRIQAISHHMVCIPQRIAYFPLATTSSISKLREHRAGSGPNPKRRTCRGGRAQGSQRRGDCGGQSVPAQRGSRLWRSRYRVGGRARTSPGSSCAVGAAGPRSWSAGRRPSRAERMGRTGGSAARQGHPLRAEMPFTTAAALPLAGLTALRLTRVTGPLASRRFCSPGHRGKWATTSSKSAHPKVLTSPWSPRGKNGCSARRARRRRSVAGSPTQRDTNRPRVCRWRGDRCGMGKARQRRAAGPVRPGESGSTDVNFFDGAADRAEIRSSPTPSDTSDADDRATLAQLCTPAASIRIGLVADWEHTAEAIEATGGTCGARQCHSPREFGHPRQHIGSKIARVQTIMILRAKQEFQNYLDVLSSGSLRTSLVV